MKAKWQGHPSSPSPTSPGVPLPTWDWIWWPGTSRRSCQSPRQLTPVSCTPSRRISPDRNNLEICLRTMTFGVCLRLAPQNLSKYSTDGTLKGGAGRFWGSGMSIDLLV